VVVDLMQCLPREFELLFEKGHCLVAMEGELAKQKTVVSTSPIRFIIGYH
jgi:hypothetical protein